MKRASQTSESIELAILLALSGGLMDAYSYIQRGQVFANAQTGNMLLLGIRLAEGSWSQVVHYLCPVAAFAAGIALADLARRRENHHLHWRQIAVLLEALILAIVAFIPGSLNLPANSLTSLACGIQVESFRKIHGNGFATTMCIGNLRGATQNMGDYLKTKDPSRLEKGLLYYGVIFCFVLGAVLGNAMIHLLGFRAILVSSGLLFLGFLLMFIDREH